MPPKAVPVVASAFLGVGLWLGHGGLYSPPGSPVWLTGWLLVIFGLLTIIFITFMSFRTPGAIVRVTILPLAVGIGIGAFLTLMQHLLIYVWFPYPLDDGEGFCLNQAVLVASGKPLYPPIDNFPYIVSNYPPVYPWFLSIFTDPNNVKFAPGRMISVISTLVIAFTAGGSVRAVTKNTTAGWITGLMVLASPVMYFWGALLRVDIFATALGMVAFYIAVTARGSKIFWTLPFLIAAFYTRQSSVEVFVAIVAALSYFRENGTPSSNSRRNGILVAVIWIAGIIGFLLVMQAVTGGEFWKHTVTYTQTKFYPARAIGNMFFIVQQNALLFLAALIAIQATMSSNPRRIFGLFFIFSFFTAMLSGKVGSDMNYFLNLLIASSMLGGLLVADVSGILTKEKNRGWLIPVLLLIPAAMYQCGFLEGNRINSFNPGLDAANYGSRVVQVLESARGPVLAEDEGFSLLSDHDVIFNPFIMSELAREGIWDQTEFVESIERKEYEIIMLRFYIADPQHDDRPGVGGFAGWDRFTDEMELAILENYELDPDVLDLYRNFERYMRRRWFIYRPKGIVLDSRSVGEAPSQITEQSE